MGQLEFFTLRLYERMQKDGFRIRTWERVCQRYKRHAAQVLKRAPRNLAAFARTSFHDCRLERVIIEEGRVRLELAWETVVRHTRGGRKKLVWWKKPYVVEFSEVERAHVLPEHVGLFWCYEELHRVGKKFELRVLMMDTGKTMTVEFGRARVKSTKAVRVKG